MSGHAAAIARARELVAEGSTEAAVELLSGLLCESPDDVDLLAALADVSRAAGLLDAAERGYRGVVERRPEAVHAAVGLADVLVAKGEIGSAVRMLTRIHNRAPDLLPVTLSLAAGLLAAGRTTDALALYDSALAKRPDLPLLHANRAEALARIGRYRESLAALDIAHSLHPDDPRISLNRAFALLVEGRVEEGLAAYEARLHPSLPTSPVRKGLGLPRWAGGPVPAGGLLVAGEQGLGDEIRFGALAWDLAHRGVPLTVEAEPRLVGLLRRSLPAAEVVAYDRRRSGTKPIYGYAWLAGLHQPPAAWIEAGSLPLRMGLPRAQPVAPHGYLKADDGRVADFRTRLAPQRSDVKRLVGLVWGSSQQNTARRRFYPALDAWGRLLGLPGMRFVDLQYTDSAADREAFRERFGVTVLPVEELDKRNDLDGAAAVAGVLDAVVGVSSSVTALAGAVGTPTIEIMAERIWLPRAGGRDAMLGSIRFAEATMPGDWPDAMERAAALLAESAAGS